MNDQFVESPLGVAAEAAGVPLSEFGRLLMRHRPTLDVMVPGWMVAPVACVGRRWDVPTEIAAAWLLAEGTAMMLVAEESDRVDWRAAGVPRLSFAGPDGADDSRPLLAQTDGPEQHNALRVLAATTGGDPDDLARVALAWGVVRLHHKYHDDEHTCPDDVSPGQPNFPLDTHEAAAVTGAPLEPLALALLSPKQIMTLALPAWVDSRLICIARRWNTTTELAATWLLAEGVGYLWAHDQKGNTAWRTGPHRWILPTHGVDGPQRTFETPGEWLQVLLHRLAALRGDTQQGLAALAVATGAECWQTDHGCCCGPRCNPELAT